MVCTRLESVILGANDDRSRGTFVTKVTVTVLFKKDGHGVLWIIVETTILGC